MNVELKAIVDLVFSLGMAGADLLQKKDWATGILPQLEGLVTQVPAVVKSWDDLKVELVALAQPAAEADLAAYVVAKFASNSEKTKAIVSAVANMAVSSVALVEALKM